MSDDDRPDCGCEGFDCEHVDPSDRDAWEDATWD